MLNYFELILCEKTRKLHERGGNYIRYGMTSDNMVRTSIDNLVNEKWGLATKVKVRFRLVKNAKIV